MAGRASRREAERLILAGRVRVDGRPVMELGTRVAPGAVVEVDGARVEVVEPRWVAFHKPPGLLTTRSDPHGGPTVYDRLPADLRSLRYVGRLDKPTEGLLLLSNEGPVIHALLHPSRQVEREYRVTVKGIPGPEALERLRRGVQLEDGVAVARRASVVSRGPREAVVALVLTEGRKREVRRMMEAIGHAVRRLVRTRFGPIELGALPAGRWRTLSEAEVDALRAAAGKAE